jgi:hypothetical protein
MCRAFENAVSTIETTGKNQTPLRGGSTGAVDAARPVNAGSLVQPAERRIRFSARLRQASARSRSRRAVFRPAEV